jgi:hypothetical protein
MSELHRVADKFFDEVDLLDQMVSSADESVEHAEISLSQAKRVRRDCNMVVKSLAQLRDDLQP